MIKKILLVFFLFMTFFSLSFAWPNEAWTKESYEIAVKNYSDAAENYKNALTDKTKTQDEINAFKKKFIEASKEYKKARKAYGNSPNSKDDFSSFWFKIDVWKMFPWNRYWKKDDYKTNIFDFLMDIIQKMMIALGSISLIIIVIWSAFLIIYHWEDSLLTKWKSIFSAWIIALIVALSSYYMIEIIKYLISLQN